VGGVLNTLINFYVSESRFIYVDLFVTCGPGSLVGIATHYGLDDPGWNPGGDELFPTCPDRPWGPPSLLQYRYRVFPGVRGGRDVGLTPHLHLKCRDPRKSRYIPLLTLRAFVAYKNGENLPLCYIVFQT